MDNYVKDFDKWNNERKVGSISDSDFGEVVSRVQNLLAIENPLAGAFSEAEATNTESIKNLATKVNSPKSNPSHPLSVFASTRSNLGLTDCFVPRKDWVV